MANTTVALRLRIRRKGGKRVYAAPAYTPNGKLKPLTALVDSKPEHHPEGIYTLRYRHDSRLVYRQVGTDPSAAQAALIRQELVMKSSAVGLSVKSDSGSARPAQPEPGVPKRSLKDAVVEYLAETRQHKSLKTFAAYKTTLQSFVACCKKQYLDNLDRKDLLDFIMHLESRGNVPRTVRNRIDFLQIFLHHFGLPSLLKGKDLPKYTKKQVRAYNDVQLDKMFGHASQEESDLLHFLLYTGVREQEAQYACWSDVDMERKTYTVTEHLDLGFRPKDKEEGTLPLSDYVVEILKMRRKRYSNMRLIFPGPNGKPNGHLLRTIKGLAFRAGVNCGHCSNKAGLSCAEHPVCKHIILHKMRKTYASKLNRANLPVRTIMRYLRHSKLETTLLYLADEDDDQTRRIVNDAFSRAGGAA